MPTEINPLDVSCPFCKVGVGTRCLTRFGAKKRRAHSTHQERIDKAQGMTLITKEAAMKRLQRELRRRAMVRDPQWADKKTWAKSRIDGIAPIITPRTTAAEFVTLKHVATALSAL